MNICDLFMLQSKYIWHAADTEVFQGYTRYSGVLTTHSAFVTKVCKK